MATGPVLMGIVNASPDSFSDGGRYDRLEDQLRLAEELAAAGAQLLDVGGQSGVTGVPEIEPAVEIERVAPLIERIAENLDVAISVDTYKPPVAEAELGILLNAHQEISALSWMAKEVLDVILHHLAAEGRFHGEVSSTRPLAPLEIGVAR